MTYYLIDTNVLVRSVHPANPMRNLTRRAIINLSRQNDVLCITPQNLIEFWSVATRPAQSNGLGFTIAIATKTCQIFKQYFVLLEDKPQIFDEWEKLVIQFQVSGKPTHDARLVAAMITHNLTHVLTFNTSDFQRFTQITAVDPATV